MLSRRLILLGVLLVMTGCGIATGHGGSPSGSSSGTTVAATFASPPQWPGHAWKRDGHEVPASEIVAAGGPLHCGWQSATFLTIGWPLGTQAQTADHARQYIRDPNGVIGQTFHAHLNYHATLPADARATGYWYGPVQLYVSPSDADRAVYLVAGQSVESWPRSDPMSACS